MLTKVNDLLDYQRDHLLIDLILFAETEAVAANTTLLQVRVTVTHNTQ